MTTSPTPPTTGVELAEAIPSEEGRQGQEENKEEGSEISRNAPVNTGADDEDEGEARDSPAATITDAGGHETTPTAPVVPGSCQLHTPTTPGEMPIIPSHLLAQRAAEEVGILIISFSYHIFVHC